MSCDSKMSQKFHKLPSHQQQFGNSQFCSPYPLSQSFLLVHFSKSFHNFHIFLKIPLSFHKVLQVRISRGCNTIFSQSPPNFQDLLLQRMTGSNKYLQFLSNKGGTLGGTQGQLKYIKGRYCLYPLLYWLFAGRFEGAV